MIKKINKKGDKLLSAYWFVILVIVAVGIVLMVNSFYGNKYDVRKQESNSLSQKVADCLYFGGELNPLLLNPQGGFKEDFRDNFLQYCYLNLTTNQEFEIPPYYIQVEIYSQSDLKKPIFNITKGNQNWIPDCSSTVSSGNLATCSNNSFFAKYGQDSFYLIKILSIVGKVQLNNK